MTKRILFNCIPLLFGILMYALPNKAHAQPGNIAPQAVVSASACNTGPCSVLNDLNFGTCGTQQMWIPTATPPSLVPGTDFIQWDFPTAKSFDTLIIHHAQTTGRFLTGFTLQNWDGAAWVTHATISGLSQANCVNRVPIGILTTNRFRITSFVPGTGQQSNMNFREIEIIAASTGTNDAAVLSVDSPRVFCAGTENVIVTIANLGINQLDSVDVDWEVNGVAQPTFRYIGLLDTAAGTLPFQAQVTLGTFNFAAGTSTIKAWTTNPNGGADTSNFNDTVQVSVQTAIAPPQAQIVTAGLTSAVATVGNATGIDYVVVPFGTPVGSGTVVANVNSPFTMTGLNASTLYDLYVRKNCGGSNVSAWVGPTTFNTAYGIPFFQDFELFPLGNTIATEGWSKVNAFNPSWNVATATGSFGTGPVEDHTIGAGGQFVYLETSSAAGVDTLYSPPIFIDSVLSTVELEFWYHMHGAAMGTLEVYADTNGVQNLLTSYVGQQHPNQTDPWLSYSAFLNGYNGKSVVLKFVGIRGTSFTSDMAIDDVRLDPVLPLDAGVTDVIAPAGNLCPGNVTPIVEVRNYGSTTIDSVKVLWDINGVVDSVNYIGTILPGARVPVTLGTVNINATTVYNIDFYTKDPNGGMDMFGANDTLAVAGLRTGLSGAITLDPALAASSTNFIDFASLESALNNYGVCGPTTVSVAAGTYNETISFDNVPGTSPTNTLTIDGGDTTLVTLENNLANTNVLVEFSNSHYITVKNMTIRSTYLGTLDHSGVHFNDSASYDSLVNCRVLMNPNATFNSMGIAASATPSNDFAEGNNAYYNVIMNNTVEGGDYSIHFEGGSGNAFNVGNEFIGNVLVNYNNYGMYLDNQSEIRIIGNDIRLGRSLFGDGIAGFEQHNFEISENKIVAQDYGIWLPGANSFDTSQVNRTAVIINNMISKLNPSQNFSAALEVERGYDVAVIHNSLYAASGWAMYFDDGFGTPAMNLIDCRNNIFKTDGDFALQIDDPDSVFTKFDNNCYESAGANTFNIDFTTYVDLPAYQAAQPLYNTASVEGDPVYASTTDLHIVGSLVNDTGDNTVNILVDIDGDVRPSVGSSNGKVDLGADEFDPPTCPPPAASSIAFLGSDSVNFAFTANVANNDIEVQVVPCGSPQTSAPGSISNTGFIGVGGLMPETCYDYYYREICGRGDTSQWLGPISFDTECAPFTATYSEGFESPMVTGVEPDCWTSYATYNQANAWARVQGFGGINAPRTGLQALYIYNWFGYTQGVDTLAAISPRMSDLTANNKQINFWAKANDPGTQIYIATAASSTAPHQFTIIDTVTITGANLFQNFIVLLDSARGYNQTDEYFALLHDLNQVNTFNYIIVDDLVYEDIPSCPQPSNLGSANPTLTSVDLSWVDNAGATQWEIEWATAGTPLGSGTRVVTTNNPYSLTGLTASTAYEFHVRAICSPGDSSAWFGPEPANTANGVPYFQDFERFGLGGPITDEGWSNIQPFNPAWQVATQTGSFGTGPVADHTIGAGGKFVYLETSSGAGIDTLYSAPIYFNPTQSAVTLEYWYHMHGAAMGTLEVYADTNGVLIPLDTFVGQQQPVQTDPWISSTNVLSGLQDQNVVIKFVGIRGTSFTSDMAVDDVRLFIPSPADGGVTEIIAPVSGCGLTASDSITVEITNFGTAALSNFPVNYTINAGTPVTETYTGSIAVGQVDTFTFATTANLSAVGSYNIDAYTSVVGDGDPANDNTVESVENVLTISFPFFEDFETTNGGWTVEGSNPSWAWGAPAATNLYINSAAGGTNAWVTNLTGDHNNNELSYLVSPCIDLSATTSDPNIYFDHIFETETNFDEGWLESSIDGGQTWTKVLANAASNWYNNTAGQYWETNNVSGATNWDTVVNTLTGSAAQAKYRLRFVMSSDGSVTNEGFGVDRLSVSFQPIGLDESSILVNGFSVSPNPSEGLFTLRLKSEKIENLNLKVKDVDGKTVYEDVISVNGTFQENIDLTKLAKGVYFMQVMSGDESRVEKLVIQ